MAANESVVTVHYIIPPASSYATQDFRAGGSTPVESFPCWDFDSASDEYLDLYCSLSPTYSGRGLTVTIAWTSTSGTSSNVRWEAAIRRMQDDTDDIDVSHTYDYNGVTAAAPSNQGEVVYDPVTFTDGADMDSLAAGEYFVLRIHRDYDHADDAMSGDAEFLGIIGKES